MSGYFSTILFHVFKFFILLLSSLPFSGDFTQFSDLRKRAKKTRPVFHVQCVTSTVELDIRLKKEEQVI